MMKKLIASTAAGLGMLAAAGAQAQAVVGAGAWQATIEGWANLTAGDCLASAADACVDRDARLDAALRMLVRTQSASGPGLGLRLVLESSPEDRADLAEASLLVFGDSGRFEIGERPGLPDVLTGYAPNSFTFTSAEFGPASGPSLDPGGGLPAAFLPGAASGVVRELGSLGFAATLFEDRSAKALYVSPRVRGFLAGVSYAEDADDPRFRQLAQSGVVHETYWRQNVLRIGGSWNHARGRGTTSDLDSLSGGVTLVLDDALMLGLSGTWNGSSGLESDAVYRSSADGWVASVNYNSGRWTVGGYLQRARGAGDAARAGEDRLDALELGLSWRYSTRVRLYVAWYGGRITDEGTRVPDANLLLVGVRGTL